VFLFPEVKAGRAPAFFSVASFQFRVSSFEFPVIGGQIRQAINLR